MPLAFRVRTSPSRDSSTFIDRRVEVEPRAGEIRIGRRAGVEVELPFPTVSGLHARVFRDGAGWAIMDLGSANGTFAGERRLLPRTPHPLKVGDTVALADVHLTFEGAPEVTAPVVGKAESTATIARRLVSDLFQALGGAEVAHLVVVAPPAASGARLPLVEADRLYKVGRAPSCDLVLDDENVSREHVALRRTWQGVFARDLGSKNGVEVGGARIVGERRLHDGEELVVGGAHLRFEDPEERYLRRMQADAAQEVARPTPIAAVEARETPVVVADLRPTPLAPLAVQGAPGAALAGGREVVAAAQPATRTPEPRAAAAARSSSAPPSPHEADPSRVVPAVTDERARAAAKLDDPAAAVGSPALPSVAQREAEPAEAPGTPAVEEDDDLRPARSRAPALFAALALVVLAGVVGLALWLFLGGS